MNTTPPLSSSMISERTRQTRRSVHPQSPETNAISQYDITLSTIRRSVFDLRSVALTQLQSFYLPFMKQVYASAAQKLAGNIKPPEEIIHSLREARGQIGRRDIQAKDAKISDLQSKVSTLYAQLKEFKPQSEIAVDIRGLEDGQKKIKRLENLLRIRNEQMFFRFKVKAVGLLEEFGSPREDIEGTQQLTSQDAVFEFLSSKLKLKLKDLRSQQHAQGEVLVRDRQEKSQYEQNIRYLTETNDLLRNNERRARDKVEELKKEWRVTCQRLVFSEKLHEQKDSELFRMKKIVEEKQCQLMKIPNLEKTHSSQVDQLRREHQTQLQSLRTLMNDYNIEINQMRSQTQNKDDQIEEHIIRQNFLQEEFQRANREQMRWKQRYEAIEKEAEQKRQALQKQLKDLQTRVTSMGIQPEEVAEVLGRNKQFQVTLEASQKQKQQLFEKITSLQTQIASSEATVEDLQMHNKQIQSSLAVMHKDKMELSERIKQLGSEKARVDTNNRELQSVIAGLQKEKTERLKGYQQQITALESHNKQLQSTLATTHRDKAELSEKLRTLEQSPRKSQIQQSSAAMQSKYRTQLSHEQTLRQALILQAISVKEVQHKDNIRTLTDAHNKRIAAMQQSFEKKMKGWQNSHDDQFLQELARVTEENSILKDKLMEKEKIIGSIIGKSEPRKFDMYRSSREQRRP